MPAWEQCTRCGGARVQGEHCLAHLTETEFAAEIAGLHDGKPLDARGVEISGELLHAIIDEFRRGKDDPPLLPASNFDRAQFTGDARFAKVQFSGRARFRWAQFSAGAYFDGVRFDGDSNFDRAQFFGDAWFRGTQFRDRTVFAETQFSGDAQFNGAEFAADAYFDEAQLSGDARFGQARFGGDAGFKEALFSGDTYFNRAEFSSSAEFSRAQFVGDTYFIETQFGGDAQFNGAEFSHDASFFRSSFRRRCVLGPLVASGTLSFDRADWEQDVQLDASASVLSMRGVRFGGRAELNVRWAEVALDSATFLQRSRLAGVAPFRDVDDARAQVSRVDRRLDADPRPRLLSLREANVENLALGNVDLRACRFFGAHGLDQLGMEADCDFAGPPRGWRHTHRRTLAEEHHWRADRGQRRHGAHGGGGGAEMSSRRDTDWHPPECQPAAWLTPRPEVLRPGSVAALYRSLRKALEDRKDEPGAADFYYGEMEMRRAAASPWPERTVVYLYWLASGYGLRATRAALCLGLTVLAGAGLLDWFGFRPDRSLGRSLLFAVESSISLLRAPEADLRAGGELVQIALRVLGPLFVGLGLLALRGRVKR